MCPASIWRRWPLKVAINRLRPRACILAYHRVASCTFDPFGQCVTPEHFAAHLQALRQDYYLESLEHLLDKLPAGAYRERTVAITFDDGYVDNYSAAYPIAAALDVPLTLFITVKPLVERKLFWWDRLGASVLLAQEPTLSLTIDGSRYHFELQNREKRVAACRKMQILLRGMSDGQRELVLQTVGTCDEAGESVRDAGTRPLTIGELQTLAKLPGVQIGAHTMTHPVLSRLAPDEQRSELEQSRAHLSELLGRDVGLMSYPFGKEGDITPETTKFVRAANYRAAFTTLPVPVLPTTDVYKLPRLTVHDWPEAEFKHKLDVFFG